MNRILSFFIAAGVAVAFSSSAFAQEFKIGYVNTERVYREANSTLAAQTKLQQEFAKREKDIMALGETLKTLSEKLDRDAPTLSESQRNTRQKQVLEQDRDFQRKRREFQEDWNARKNEELQTLVDRANRVVKQIAEAEKYDLVLQEVVYINPKHDITDKVVKALNAQR